mmetsp:Transcript_24268/g.29852  ORF Transcript_24268/g.29852 Transcript_24268/m.29852 type:complete len:329 (-) Transcript_24268:94-1080(-)
MNSKSCNESAHSSNTTNKRNHNSERKRRRRKEAVFTLIETGDWEKVRKVLKSRSGEKISRIVEDSGLTPLAMAIGSKAPADVVRLFIELNPSAVLQRDIFGSMPLHLGCLNGISLEVMHMIYNVDNGHSARVPDQDNRSALHHAVEQVCMLMSRAYNTDASISSSISAQFEEAIEKIEFLLSIAPETLHYMAKKTGDTPLDIPQIVKAGLKINEHAHIDEVYQILHGASIHYYLQRKKEWEDKGYDTSLRNSNATGLEKMGSSSIPSLNQISNTSSSQVGSKHTNLESSSLLYQMKDISLSISSGFMNSSETEDRKEVALLTKNIDSL